MTLKQTPNNIDTEANVNNSQHSSTVKLSYSLTAWDILVLILKIHAVLLVLPLVFLLGHIILLLTEFGNVEAYVTFVLFALSFVGIVYIYIRQYFIFKRQYYFETSDDTYHAEISSNGVKIYKKDQKNLTEYIFTDFIRARENKKKLYLYFRYDRALIIKKQLFVVGDQNTLRKLIKSNISNFRTKFKS